MVIFSDKWELPPLFPNHDRRDPETIRLLPLIIGTILAFISFATFNDNAFDLVNVTLWLLAIAFFVYALWLPYRRVRQEQSAERRHDMLWSTVNSRRGCAGDFLPRLSDRYRAARAVQ